MYVLSAAFVIYHPHRIPDWILIRVSQDTAALCAQTGRVAAVANVAGRDVPVPQALVAYGLVLSPVSGTPLRTVARTMPESVNLGDRESGVCSLK